uniref:Peroxisomal ATPase PEX1 n=1 Tax=Photinus pyralis TaxID=7054 RepID=A0A1Y1N724_PHOPY
MNFKIFTVKYITYKTCFCYFSEQNARFFDKGITLELSYDNKSTFFSAQPLSSLKEGEVGLNRLQAQLLGLREDVSVMISGRYDVPGITRVVIRPKSIEDYEVLEILSESVQSTLLNQLRIVRKDQEFVIWISDSLHLPVNVESMEPANLGRLDFLTEVEVAPPKPKIAEVPDVTTNNSNWNFLEFLNPFKQSQADSKTDTIDKKYTKRCYPVCFNLLPVADLSDVKGGELDHFNAFVSKHAVPKNVSSGDIFRLGIIIPPAANTNLSEETFEVKNVVVRIHILDHLVSGSLMYVHSCMFKHFDLKAGAKAFLSDHIHAAPLVDSIEICTYAKKSTNAIGKFKLLISRNSKTQKVILNSNVLMDCSGYQFSLKFQPSNVTFCVADSNFVRNCKFSVTEGVPAGRSCAKVEPQKYCGNFARFSEIVQPSYDLLTSEDAENLLLIGKVGSGKTVLVKVLIEKLALSPLYIHSEVISCKAVKGKSLDSLGKVFANAILNCIYYQPSVLVLEDLHVLCEKVVAGDAPTPESLNFDRVSEMLAHLLHETVKSNRILILATATSLLKLNDHIYSSRGQHLFKNVYEIGELKKPDRVSILEFLFKEKCQIDDFSMDHLAQKTEGFVVQDLVDFVDKAVFESVKEDSSNVTLGHCELALQNSVALSLKDIQLHSPGEKDFTDVGGLEDVKKILIECMLWPVQYPHLFDNAPLRLQSGLLLYGPPGTGKTILAGAAAKHCGLRLISIKGPELLSKYIGASEQAVRDVFEKAQSAKPCILFFDEFDSLAPRRGHDSTGVTDRVVNQLLTQLDGVESLSGVCVLAATSRPDLLDPALLRPGRLDRQILCPLPDQPARLKILQSLSKKMRLATDIDLEEISQQSTGYSGADLQAVLYTAQLCTVEKLDTEELQVCITLKYGTV